jgi:uncharacterized protein (DUF2252 family)
MTLEDLPPIEEATSSYERWMARYAPIVRADLALKHEWMRHDSFKFMRATFYRWQQVWPRICGDAARAPSVVAVGDLHVENFGTWRDLEGRLIWGVNDFDEAARLPYTNDVIRLATSAYLAIDAAHLHLSHLDAAEAILDGYLHAIQTGGRPFVLEAEHRGLRKLALSDLRDPTAFWAKLQTGKGVSGAMQPGARKALEALMPHGVKSYIVRRRVAGIGSLGRPRFVAIADCLGAPIAREAKARIPSACAWSGAAAADAARTILARAVRVSDPYFDIRPRWIVRRLAPDCSRIALANLPAGHDEHRLLHAMGAETANIHLGSAGSRRLQRDLARRSAKWLDRSAQAMSEAISADWRRWQRQG